MNLAAAISAFLICPSAVSASRNSVEIFPADTSRLGVKTGIGKLLLATGGFVQAWAVSEEVILAQARRDLFSPEEV